MAKRGTTRTVGLIGAVTCLVAIGMVSLSGQAFARAPSGGGGHAAPAHAGGGHFARGYGHGGYGGRGAFIRGGHHYHYGPDGVLIEDCCYAPVYVAPPVPVVVAPFGVYVR